ncbi:hypothetical protein Tco_0536444 [Tanacetum coccineum]
MVQPILNPTEGKMLMMMDDEQVPKKIINESLVIRLLEVNNIVEQLGRAVDDTKTVGVRWRRFRCISHQGNRIHESLPC